MTNTRTCGTLRQHAAAAAACASHRSLAGLWHRHMLGGAGSPP
jgi:hypothetical protein